MKTWTNAEVEIVKKYYSMPVIDLAGAIQELGRPGYCIKNKAYQMGLSKSVALTEEEISYIKEHGTSNSISDIARHLNRNWLTVRKVIAKFNIPRTFRVHNKWEPTEAEIEVLKSNKPSTEIAVELNKSMPTIFKFLRKFGIKVERVRRQRGSGYQRYSPRVVKEARPVTPSAPRETGGEDRIRASMMRLGLI